MKNEDSTRCQICEKTFTRVSDLNRHRKYLHEKEEKLKCFFCPTQFGQPGCYYRHLKNIHRVTKEAMPTIVKKLKEIQKF